MCGIFGISLTPALQMVSKSNIGTEKALAIFKELALLSKRRGQESSGFAIRAREGKGWKIDGYKEPIHIVNILKSDAFRATESYLIKNNVPFDLIGHARLVTNGDQNNNENNQPIFDSTCAVIHNGIITNISEIDSGYNFNSYGVGKDVDTKFIHKKFSTVTEESGLEIWRNLISQIKGTASIATFSINRDELTLASNNGSLYVAQFANFLVFASEECFLTRIAKQFGLPLEIKKPSYFEFVHKLPRSREEHLNFQKLKLTPREFPKSLTAADRGNPSLLEDNRSRVKQIQRCTKCILPATFPFIAFDNQGVCNFCNNYKKIYTGQENVADFKKTAESFKQKYKRSRYDCLVPFSGGRDSSYGLHLIVKELGLRPVTFTYDWGMVTDLARRNIARMCGELGVENIVVSANLKKKRDNIRKNVLAWLKRPHLGLIPLFMAGDKYFFYYNNLLRKELGIEFDVWMTNKLENTDFKVGYCDIPPNFGKKRIDALSFMETAKMPLFYLKQYFLNPRFWNSSIFDTIGSFYSYYVQPRDGYYRIFDHYPWDEGTVNKTIIGEYGWETSPDFKSTWRIGDGTAAFYNYVYYTVGGFTEIDTFRSNQIREGMITRDEALELANEENIPRFTSIKWYLDILGIDFNMAISEINKIPKLYDFNLIDAGQLSEVR